MQQRSTGKHSTYPLGQAQAVMYYYCGGSAQARVATCVHVKGMCADMHRLLRPGTAEVREQR